MLTSSKIDTEEREIPQDSQPVRVYKLQFRHLNRANYAGGPVKEFMFNFAGPLKDAVARAREHCQIMDYKYVYCCPAILDLESREELKTKFNKDDYYGEEPSTDE